MGKRELFLYFDGDGIGDCLELLLLDNKAQEARDFSAAIERAMLALRSSLLDDGATTVFLGGDDLVVRLAIEGWQPSRVESLRKEFKSSTGCSISCGVGTSPAGALGSLRRAKLSGKDMVVSEGVEL
ncbi:MAG: hypothetical protein GY719_42205 [bacterium]|nr:hypothetical protein [bacterium]